MSSGDYRLVPSVLFIYHTYRYLSRRFFRFFRFFIRGRFCRLFGLNGFLGLFGFFRHVMLFRKMVNRHFCPTPLSIATVSYDLGFIVRGTMGKILSACQSSTSVMASCGFFHMRVQRGQKVGLV